MIATLLRLLTGVRAHWVGFDPDEAAASSSTRPRVYFANHTSHLDGAVIWASLPANLRQKTRPVAAQDYWSAGRVRRWLANDVFRCVLVERQKVNRVNNPMKAMQDALESGESLIIFPEGTRSGSEDGTIGEFKPGLFHIGRACEALEFVPVYLENLNRILPKGDFLFIPLLATAYFGRPVKLEPGESKQAFLVRAKSAIEALQAEGGPHA